MKPEWKTFLTDAGAELDDGRVATFGNPERELQIATTGNVICDLSHYGLIGVHGSEARDFLYRQLTNDIGRVDPAHSQLNAYLTAKGRMLACFRVFQRGDHYFLRLPQTLVEPVLQRLRMFVLRSDVSLEDGSDDLIRIGCAGPQIERELAEAIGQPVPENPAEVLQTEALTVVRVPGADPRFEVYGHLDAMQQAWPALNVRGAPIGSDGWTLHEVRAGLPVIHPETQETFVPQMANLDLVGGVAFDKGCYPGQEVVARMHYLGNLKRRMYRMRVPSTERPRPGDSVYTGAGGEPAGTVAETAPSPDGGYELLAVINIAAAEAGDLHLGEAAGPALEHLDLPYEITTRKTGSG